VREDGLSMPIGGNYTVEEWDAIKESASLSDIPDEQLMLLHRHWIWADHARLTFEEALRTEKWDHGDIKERTPWAMYTWYGLLYVLIEGATQRACASELSCFATCARFAMRSARQETQRSTSARTRRTSMTGCLGSFKRMRPPSTERIRGSVSSFSTRCESAPGDGRRPVED
jgi:hypothetical protein